MTGKLEGHSEARRLGESGAAMKYAAVVEKAGNGYSTYTSHLPGCVVAGG